MFWYSVALAASFVSLQLTDNSGIDSSFIASAQSPVQRAMIETHPENAPLYVEGRYTVWLRDTMQIYFVLRADSDPKLFETLVEDLDGKFDLF